MRTAHIITLAFALLTAASASQAQPIKRDVQPGAVIARSVEIPPGASTLWVSGIPSNVAGGTGAQTADALRKLGEVLRASGYDYADVVNVKVYLVADPATGKMDFAAMNAAFSQVFGTAAQPNKPSRVTVQVAALGLPGALVEIELTAAKVKPATPARSN